MMVMNGHSPNDSRILDASDILDHEEELEKAAKKLKEQEETMEFVNKKLKTGEENN